MKEGYNIRTDCRKGQQEKDEKERSQSVPVDTSE